MRRISRLSELRGNQYPKTEDDFGNYNTSRFSHTLYLPYRKTRYSDIHGKNADSVRDSRASSDLSPEARDDTAVPLIKYRRRNERPSSPHREEFPRDRYDGSDVIHPSVHL